MVKKRILLSYNAIDKDGLQAVLNRYADKLHDELISDFERELATWIGTKQHVVALNSGTAAIHLALKALGVGSGDEVIVSTFTFVATANPILYLGAHPVFIDSESTTWNMDPELLRSALRERTALSKKVKAILVVDAYGMPAQWDELLSIAREFNVPIIEDAAEAVGSSYHARPAGTLADIGIFSFNNNKTLTTFGGGAVVTANIEWANKIRFWSSQSLVIGSYYQHSELGYNYRISPLSAAYGLSQLPLLHEKIKDRVAIFERYCSQLSGQKFTFQQLEADVFSNRWLSAFCFPKGLNEQALVEGGIDTRSLWNPMHLQAVFKDAPAYINGVGEDLFNRGICLPSGDGLSRTDLEDIVSNVTGLLLMR